MAFGDLFDFSDWEEQGIEKVIISNTGITGWTVDSNPAKFEDDNSANTATENLEINNFNGIKYYANQYDIYWQIKFISPDRDLTGHLKFYVRETSGAYYKIQFNEIDDPGAQSYRFDHEYYDGTTTYDQDGTKLNSSGLNGSWLWIRVQVTVSGNDRVFALSYDLNNETDWRDVSSWTTAASPSNITATNQKNISFISPLEVQVVGDTSAQQTFHTNQIETDSSDTPYTFDQSTDLSAYEVREIYARNQLGGEGRAHFKLYDEDLANLSSIDSLLRTELTWKFELSGDVFWHGDIIDYELFPPDTVWLVCEPIYQKLTKTRVAFASNLLEAREIRNINVADDKIHDTTGGFPQTNDWDGKLVLFEKNKFKEMTIHPSAVSYETSFSDATGVTPDNTNGSVYQLYHKNHYSTNRDDVGVYAEFDNGFSNEFLAVFDIDIWLITGTTIKSAKVEMDLKTRPIDPSILSINHKYTLEPEVGLYDYTNLQWVNPDIYDIASSNGHSTGKAGSFNTTGSSASPVHSLEIDLEDVDPDTADSITDYYTTGAAAGNFTKHTFKVGVWSGKTANTATKGDLLVLFLALHLVVDTIQEPEYAQGLVAGSTDDDITFDSDANISWIDKEVPSEDGIYPGDNFFVVEDLESLFSSLWASGESGLADNFTLDWETNLGNTNGITEDVQNDYVYDLLQRASEMLNSAWFWQYISTNTPADTIVHKSSYTSSGVTLTEADFGDDIQYLKKTGRQRDELYIVGKNGLSKSVSLTEEYTHNLGKETEIIFTDIDAPKELGDYGTNKTSFYQNAEIICYLTINYSRPKQDYTPLLVGKTVAVTYAIGGSTILNHTSGNDGELLIWAMELNRNEANSYEDEVTFTLMKRS